MACRKLRRHHQGLPLSHHQTCAQRHKASNSYATQQHRPPRSRTIRPDDLVSPARFLHFDVRLKVRLDGSVLECFLRGHAVTSLTAGEAGENSGFRAAKRYPHHIGRARRTERDTRHHDNPVALDGKPFAVAELGRPLGHVIHIIGIFGDDGMDTPHQRQPPAR